MLSISTQFIQKGYRLLKRKFGKKISFNNENIVRHNVDWGSFVEKLLPIANAYSLKLVGTKDGINVRLSFENQSIIDYRFKYDSDGLILLRGVAIKKGKKYKYIVSPHSIPDFAISARPAGFDCKMEWVPSHGTVNKVAVNLTLSIIVNGKQLSKKDALSTENVNSVKFIQTFDAVNPHASDEVMWGHSVSHEICLSDPYCEITNLVEIKNDTEIKSMYLTMLPAVSSNVSKLLLNNGTEIVSIATDGTDLDVGDDISSAIYLSETPEGAIDVATVDEISLLSEEANLARITFRSDDVSKFYLNKFSGKAKSGTSFSSKQRIMCLSSIENFNK
jgi:hypothetical protein